MVFMLVAVLIVCMLTELVSHVGILVNTSGHLVRALPVAVHAAALLEKFHHLLARIIIVRVDFPVAIVAGSV